MDLVFGYLAGLLTLINPCVLPVLPVILISAINQHKLGPLALSAGMGLSFVTLGVAVASLGPALGIDDLMVSRAAAVLMIGFGIVLLVPKFGAVFSTATAGASNSASTQLSTLDSSGGSEGLRGQFLTGVLLGAVWSPCVGPTLGAAIALAAEGKQVIWAAAIMTAFALGISTIIIVLSYGARETLMKRKSQLQSFSERARPITGVIMLALGLAIFFDLFRYVDNFLLDVLPFWFQDLSVVL